MPRKKRHMEIIYAHAKNAAGTPTQKKILVNPNASAMQCRAMQRHAMQRHAKQTVQLAPGR